MAILMAMLEDKFRTFEEFGGSNSNAGSSKKSGNNKDLEKESKKGQRKRDQVPMSSLLPNLCLKWK
jgi:CCR4-NOT transcriptional regulation complex NOT5 subunit